MAVYLCRACGHWSSDHRPAATRHGDYCIGRYVMPPDRTKSCDCVLLRETFSRDDILHARVTLEKILHRTRTDG